VLVQRTARGAESGDSQAEVLYQGMGGASKRNEILKYPRVPFVEY
jgi:hypothetical protein